MKNFLILFFFCFASAGFSQNLVPNPSFEDTVMCPESTGQIFRAEHWDTFRESPDYFNVCNDSFASVPNNVFGYQYPSTGVAYAGVKTYFTSQYREYLGVQLSGGKTNIGERYYFSMKLNVARGGQGGANCSSNNFGMKLSTVSYSYNNPAPIDNNAIIHLSFPILDTVNWVSVIDSFIADSEYTYLIMGNFYDDEHTDTTQFSIFQCHAIYYIDDVCLSKTIDSCDFINSLYSINKSNIKVFPNPVRDILIIESPFEIKSTIYNHLGKETELGQRYVIVQKIKGGYSTSINIETAPPGVYYLETISNNNISNFKIVKL
jgi:hypothetical protein